MMRIVVLGVEMSCLSQRPFRNPVEWRLPSVGVAQSARASAWSRPCTRTTSVARPSIQHHSRSRRRVRVKSPLKMTTLSEEDAWRMVMAAGDVLSGRVSLVEAPLSAGSMATQYEVIDVKVYDPASHVFAQLPTSSGRGCGLDYVEYARSTRAALAAWVEIARCPGFSVDENPAFWVRAMRELTPHSHSQVSHAPSFLAATGTRFPRFRLTFQPKDLYDEDQHDLQDAVDWVRTFCDAFFDGGDVNERAVPSEMAVPVELTFRVPLMRTHSSMGSVLQQHRHFIENARQLASQLTGIAAHKSTNFNVTGCSAILRGTVLAREFAAIAPFFDSRSPLRISELCLELDEDLAPDPDALKQAIETTRVKTIVTNVSRASPTSLQRLLAALRDTPSVHTLRLFNAFAGSPTDRRSKWKQLAEYIAASQLRELVLERVHFDDGDMAVMREEIQSYSTSQLTAITVKPVAGSIVSSSAYVDLIKMLGQQLTHVDLSALCWQSADVDSLMRSCPQVRSLRLGQVDTLADSCVFEVLRQPSCQLASLSLSCSEDEARGLANLLADQPLDVALTNSHLAELCLNVDAADEATRKALLDMLDTNHSLRFFHLKQRAVQLDAAAAQTFAAHHNRQLVRQLPMMHKAAFLSVLHQASGEFSTLQCFDTGIASEILGFAGHAVRRQFLCTH